MEYSASSHLFLMSSDGMNRSYAWWQQTCLPVTAAVSLQAHHKDNIGFPCPSKPKRSITYLFICLLANCTALLS